MQLTGEQILWLSLVPLALGTIIFVAILLTLKRDVLELVRSDSGALVIRIFALTFVAFWIGILTIAGKVPESAATAIFGGILGYVFGVGAESAMRRPGPTAPPAKASEADSQESER
jgi:hypothetical protein